MSVANLFAAMNLLGLPTQFDPNDGTSAGPAFVPTDLDPNNQTRSDARRTYFDPYVGRSNFHVITGQHVTRLLIDGVGGNSAADNPTAGGNPGGNGPSTGNNEGFGFGPQGRTPPLVGRTSSRFARRQSPGTASLRISGVEVNLPLHSTRAMLKFSSLPPMPTPLAKRYLLHAKLLLLLVLYTLPSSFSYLVLARRLC